MKAAANVIAVVAWCAFIGTLCYPLLTDEMASFGFWLAAVVMTFFVGVVVPSYLLGIERPASKPMRSGTRGE